MFFCISDPDITAEIEIWKEPIFNLTQEVVGTSAVFLDGTRPSCRNYECNMGQFCAVDTEVETWWPEITLTPSFESLKLILCDSFSFCFKYFLHPMDNFPFDNEKI